MKTTLLAILLLSSAALALEYETFLHQEKWLEIIQNLAEK